MWVDIPYIDPTGFACTIACWWKTNHADVLGKHQGATLTGNITPFQTNCFTKHFWTINQYGFRENICLLPKSPAKKSVPLQVFFSCFNAKKGSQQKSSPPSSPKKKTGRPPSQPPRTPVRRLLFYRQRQLARGRLGRGDEAFPNLRTGQIDGHHVSAQGLGKCSRVMR